MLRCGSRQQLCKYVTKNNFVRRHRRDGAGLLRADKQQELTWKEAKAALRVLPHEVDKMPLVRSSCQRNGHQRHRQHCLVPPQHSPPPWPPAQPLGILVIPSLNGGEAEATPVAQQAAQSLTLSWLPHQSELLFPGNSKDQPYAEDNWNKNRAHLSPGERFATYGSVTRALPK